MIWHIHAFIEPRPRGTPRPAEELFNIVGGFHCRELVSFIRGGILNSALLSRVWSSMLMRRRIINPSGAVAGTRCLAKLWISARAYPQARWGFCFYAVYAYSYFDRLLVYGLSSMFMRIEQIGIRRGMLASNSSCRENVVYARGNFQFLFARAILARNWERSLDGRI